VKVRIEVEVANFYPAIATGFSMPVYEATQSSIHVLVTHAFLRSLARLNLARSKVGRFAAGRATGIAAGRAAIALARSHRHSVPDRAPDPSPSRAPDPGPDRAPDTGPGPAPELGLEPTPGSAVADAGERPELGPVVPRRDASDGAGS
jgi:hypothetical protein